MRTLSLLPALLIALQPLSAAAQAYDPVMTRADFVRLVMEEHGFEEHGGERCFSDVRTQTFAQAVCAAKEEGLVTGDPDGRFRPYDHVSFAEGAAMVVRAEGITVKPDVLVWYRPYLILLDEWDALPPGSADPARKLSRSQALAMIRDAADRGGNDDDEEEDDEDEEDDDGNGDIRLRLSVSDDQPEAGDRVTFRIRLENLTDDDLEDEEVTAELDDDMDYISSTEDGEDDGDEVEWDDLEIDEDGSLTLLLNVEIDEDADDGDALRLRAEAGGASATLTVRVGDDEDDDEEDPELESIDVSDSPDPVRPGDTIRYRITLENGDEDIDPTVRAFLPDNLHFVEAEDDGRRSGDTVVWDDVELDAHEEVTLEFEVRVDDDVLDGQEVSIRVEAAGEEETEFTEIDGEWDSGDERVTVFISDTPDPARRGDTLTYRLTIENDEREDIRVDARVFIDAATTYVSASNGGSLTGVDEIHWNDVKVEEGDSTELTLTVTVDAGAPSLLYLFFEAGDDDDAETTSVQ